MADKQFVKNKKQICKELLKIIEDFDIPTNDPDYYNEQLVKFIKQTLKTEVER